MGMRPAAMITIFKGFAQKISFEVITLSIYTHTGVKKIFNTSKKRLATPFTLYHSKNFLIAAETLT